jgi:serine/threonine protein phosphatase PrpC
VSVITAPKQANGDRVCRSLIAAAYDAAGRDNATIVLLRVRLDNCPAGMPA